MADRGPLSNRDMPRQNNGYGNNGYGNPGSGNNGHGNSGNGNSGYGNTGYNNTGYGNTGYGNMGYGNTAHGNNGYGNHGYNNSGNRNGGYDNFDRRGSVDVRKPQQQNAYRMRNNRNNNWQRGPVAPSNSWREQGRTAELGSRNNPGWEALTPGVDSTQSQFHLLPYFKTHCKQLRVVWMYFYAITLLYLRGSSF